MRYAMVIEKGDNNNSAYLPDQPGCVTTGDTIEELKRNMQEAIELHLEGLREGGLPISEPSEVDFIEETCAEFS